MPVYLVYSTSLPSRSGVWPTEAALRHNGKPDKQKLHRSLKKAVEMLLDRRLRQLRSFILVALMTFVGSFLEAKISPASLKVLKEVVQRYRDSACVEMEVEKKVFSDLLGTDQTYHGSLALAPKRFRFESDENLVVFDGKYLWTVQYPMKGSPGKTQIMRALLGKKNQTQVMLTDLLMGESILNHFDILSDEGTGDTLRLKAKPKVKDDQITDLTLVIDKSKKEISELSYGDELGNKTTMQFSGVELSKKAQPKKFKYTPEKGAEVTDL
jgi:outer membrane lipoprotein-sorting protein